MQNILAVVPNHDQRVALRHSLEKAGYFVFTSGTGIDGLALLQRIRSVSAILLESHNLPIMSAEQFLAIKNQDQGLATIPVLLLGSPDRNFQNLGVTDYVGKPIDLDGLIKLIRQYAPLDEP